MNLGNPIAKNDEGGDDDIPLGDFPVQFCFQAAESTVAKNYQKARALAQAIPTIVESPEFSTGVDNRIAHANLGAANGATVWTLSSLLSSTAGNIQTFFGSVDSANAMTGDLFIVPFSATNSGVTEVRFRLSNSTVNHTVFDRHGEEVHSIPVAALHMMVYNSSTESFRLTTPITGGTTFEYY